MGLGIVDPQPQQHRGSRTVFRNLSDFTFAVVGRPVHPGIVAGPEPGIQFDGVGIDHPVSGNPQLAQGPDLSVTGHIEAGSLVDQQIQDMEIRIGFHGIMYFQLRDMFPQDIIVFLNLLQRQYQKRSSIPFRQAGDSILSQLEKTLFVHYPSPFGPAAAVRTCRHRHGHRKFVVHYTTMRRKCKRKIKENRGEQRSFEEFKEKYSPPGFTHNNALFFTFARNKTIQGV